MSEPEPNEVVTTSPETETVAGAPRTSSSIPWVIAGVIAAACSIATVKVTMGNFEIPLPQEYIELSSDGRNEANTLKSQLMKLDYDGKNLARIVAAVSAVLSLVFGITAGIASGSIGRGLVGGVVGLIAALPLAFLLGGIAIALQNAGNDNAASRDMIGMGLHAVSWLAAGIPVSIAIGIGCGTGSAFAKGLGAMFLAAVFAGILYVLVGGILTPHETLTDALPNTGIPIYLWTLVAPLLTGLFLARLRPSYR